METRDEQLSSSYEYILGIPKPRRVQANPVILIIIGSLPIASVFLIYSGVQTIRSLQQIRTHASLLYLVVVEFIFPFILLAISGTVYLKLRRDVNLIRDGELATGVVTHQKLIIGRGGRGGRRNQSRIRYRFKDPAGRLFQGTGTDHTQSLQINMTVPVFYKPEDPEQNVSICTAICELRRD
jgi:hypothetical protein